MHLFCFCGFYCGTVYGDHRMLCCQAGAVVSACATVSRCTCVFYAVEIGATVNRERCCPPLDFIFCMVRLRSPQVCLLSVTCGTVPEMRNGLPVYLSLFFVCSMLKCQVINCLRRKDFALAVNVPRACEVRGFGALRCPREQR